ncbi:MAG: capsule assembly Wzi family protein [Bacteroidota bacterium]
MRLPLALALLAVLASPALAQHEGLLEVDSDLAQFLLRQQTAGRLPGAPMDVQPISAYDAQRWLDSLALDLEALPSVDRALLSRYRGETPGPNAERVRGLLGGGVYSDGETVFAAEGDGWGLEIDPLLYVVAGQARRTETATREPTAPAWQSSRGVRFAGHVGKHIFFHSQIEENQVRPAILQTLDADPNSRAGLTAPRRGDINVAGGTTLDYWGVSGAVGYRDRFLEVRLGRDDNRWGPGRNSLVLSDFASTHDQLQVRAQFGPVRYTSNFARLQDPVRPTTPSSNFLPSKYGAFHRLQLALPANLDLGLSEAVIFADDTTDGLRRGFDVGYLNPVIFYRAVEAQNGSSDNVLLSADLAWRPVPGVRTYGQLILDEFRFSEFGTDWWGNKFGWMLGAHLVDPGLAGLDLRVEFARLRPYLYSHRSEFTAFTHWADGLGHPAGPNAQDLSVFGRYRPLPNVEAAFNLAYTIRGLNTETENFGSDPRVSFDTRIDDFGIETLQGVRQTQWLGEVRVGVEVLPRLMLEATAVGQVWETDSEETRAVAVLGGVRWGVPFRSERW